MNGSPDLKGLQVAAVAIIGVAVVTVMGILILEGIKPGAGSAYGSDYNNATHTSQTNTTINNFITGLAVTGGFISILILALIGKTVVRMFRGTS